MADFNEREKAFEAKFKLDQELRFKATARRNKLLGVWAAQMMGLNELESESYSKEVIKSDFEKPGDDDVLQKVLTDLQGKDIDIYEKELLQKMDDLLEVAIGQVQTED